MEKTHTYQKLAFLQGGGEMGKLTRAYDWSVTSLGSPYNWPQSLRTTLSILLNSKFPMFLFWGDEHICFYNDAYRPSLGKEGKHPGILGQKAVDSWPEIWDTIGPQMESIVAGGEATWHEDQFLPIYRNNMVEDVYWTYSYSPVKNEDGEVGGVLVVCNETSQKIQTLSQLKDSDQRFQNLVREATVGIIVLSGAEMVVKVVNDAYARLVGHRSEDLLGKPLFSIIPDARDFFFEILNGVRLSGHSTYRYDQEYVVNGSTGAQIKGYLNLIYQPYIEENGEITGVMALCQDVTEQVSARKKAGESEHRFRTLIEASPVRTLLVTGADMILEIANEQALRGWGKDRSILGKPLLEVLPEMNDQPFPKILKEVYDSGKPYAAVNMPVSYKIDGEPRSFYFDLIYQPLRTLDGEVYGVLSTAIDVTEKMLGRKAIEESERNLRNIIRQAPVAMCILRNADFIVEIANERMFELWGRSQSELTGRPLFEALPEASGQGFEELLQKVFITGEAFSAYGIPVELPRASGIETVYINFLYEAFREADGSITGVMAVATNVTAQILVSRQVAEREQQLRSVVENAPFPIGIYVGRELRIELANQSIIEIFGKGPAVIGKLYRELLPELEGTGIFEQMDGVYTTGKPYHTNGQRVDIKVDGTLREQYFNYSLTPLFNTVGEVYAVMNTAAEVTDIIKSRQKTEEAEASLRGAIGLAELGTWEIDMIARILDYDARTREWFGIAPGEIITPERAYQPVREADRPLIKAAIEHAITPGTDGIYDVEYTVDSADGIERILHAQGKAFYNEAGVVYKISGTAQDVTAIRKREHGLERQVQERTAELAAKAAELATANTHLQRSNEELAQYAYVASHDLQEPLRKIRVFAGMLEKQEGLSGGSRQLVQKMDRASERMSLLINDLLEFSRLLNSETMLRPVSLTEICRAVVSDFELSIREKAARVQIGELPRVSAVSLQMNQLFYNLLSNALKFSKPDVAPVICVSARPMRPAEVSDFIASPNSKWLYYDITVSDNGIGFDTSYAEQIFEVFKRLHGRDIYPGSGIGLALCRRIAINAQGYLYAESSAGAGAIFHIILPDRQG